MFMFGNPRRSSDEEFDDLDLLALENESLTRAPLISPMQSPILPTAIKLRKNAAPKTILIDMFFLPQLKVI